MTTTDDIETVPLIRTQFDLEGRDVVCYPYVILGFKVEVPRMFFKPRTVYTVVTADLVKGVVARSNMIPDTESVEIGPSAVVPQLVSEEEAIRKARKLVLRWIMYKYHSIRAPYIEVVRKEHAYKAFFQAEKDGRSILVDSVKGLERDDL